MKLIKDLAENIRVGWQALGPQEHCETYTGKSIYAKTREFIMEVGKEQSRLGVYVIFPEAR